MNNDTKSIHMYVATYVLIAVLMRHRVAHDTVLPTVCQQGEQVKKIASSTNNKMNTLVNALSMSIVHL